MDNIADTPSPAKAWIITGPRVYFDENGKPMLGATRVRGPEFAGRVVAETRALLTTVPGAA